MLITETRLKHNAECSVIVKCFGACNGFYCSCKCHGDWNVRRILGLYFVVFLEKPLDQALQLISGKNKKFVNKFVQESGSQ